MKRTVQREFNRESLKLFSFAHISFRGTGAISCDHNLPDERNDSKARGMIETIPDHCR